MQADGKAGLVNSKERKRRIREQQLEAERSARDEVRSTKEEGRYSSHDTRHSPEWETNRCVRVMKRAREFNALLKKEGIRQRPMVLKNANPKISPQMMKWRRISSITLRLEPVMDNLERRAGLEKLMGWLEKAFLERQKIVGCPDSEAIGVPKAHPTATDAAGDFERSRRAENFSRGWMSLRDPDSGAIGATPSRDRWSIGNADVESLPMDRRIDRQW